MDLHEATVEELVQELVSRATFRGLVVWQKEYKGLPNSAWQWGSRDCDAIAICDELSEKLRQA